MNSRLEELMDVSESTKANDSKTMSSLAISTKKRNTKHVVDITSRWLYTSIVYWSYAHIKFLFTFDRYPFTSKY